MKTIKTLALLLLTATGLLAQPNPDNMFIDGYVTDASGNAVANQQVCVYYNSSNPALPSDSLCTNTDSIGYYFLPIQNGSLTGPNVDFNVFTYDPCSQQLLTQTRSNYQGTIDTANVNFHVCLNGTGCNGLTPLISTTSNWSNNQWVIIFTAGATGGTPAYTYQWGGVMANQTGPTVTYLAAPNQVFDICLTVADANGCTATTCDTVYSGGSQNPCTASIQVDSSLLGISLTASSTGVAPFTYLWNSGDTTAQISGLAPDSVYCVTVTDANGCMATDCYTNANSIGCSAYIQATTDSFGITTFVASSNGTAPFTYSWSTGQITQSIMAEVAGVYCVEVIDANGCSATACDTIPQPNSNGCSVQISSSQNPVDPYTYLLSASSSGVAPFTYLWDNGDTTQTVTYSFNQQGIFGACVTVTDATGCTATDCDTLVVDTNSTGNCTAGFYYYSSSNPNNPIVEGEAVNFYFSGSLANTNFYSWSVQGMGASLYSYNMNPVFTFPAAGTYQVCVTVYDSLINCSDTQCMTVWVDSSTFSGCDASFISSGQTPIGYTFTANVQDSSLYYYWTIDNQFAGNGSSLYSPGFTNGVHTICLNLIDSLNMCSDQQCQTITVGSNNCYGYISGQVYAGSSNQPLDLGVVYLITYDSLTNQLTAVDSMVVDSGNYYFFGPLACGNYLVKAAASQGSQYFSNHIPTYYGNSPFWGFAQTVSLAQANSQVAADITLIAANNPGGSGFIGGDVTQGANKTDEGDPLAGMEVLLFTENGDAVAHTVTDASGTFSFSDLGYGTYQVYVEVLGVQTIPAVVTIGENEPSVNDVHILASETLISTGIEAFNFDGAISEVYPNPVADRAYIGFNLPSEVMVDISILDLTGRTISTESVAIAGGENKFTISTDKLNSGYYFLNIQDVDGNFSVTRKFMRVD
ncbi:MAG: T9SS type A sorting domain-containing protein [Flavobacteriales bacterium]|nr:T9SS type A sorting domain-containing protein [Flavobacteriales bacterium]